jgi:hypothetical protein
MNNQPIKTRFRTRDVSTVTLTRDEGAASLTELVRRIEACEWKLGIRKDAPKADNGPSSPAATSDGAREAAEMARVVGDINRKNREMWGIK